MLGLSPEQLAVALVAALAAAFVRGLAGFGMAILLVPVLGLAIPPTEAVVTANWLGIFIGLVGLRAMLGASERSAFTIAGLAMVATPLGVWLLSVTDPALARLLIALVALVAFALVLLPKRPDGHRPSGIETGGTGIACGVLTGFAGMPGVPVVPFYLRRQIAPQLARASMMTIFLATSVAGVGSAMALQVATWRELLLASLLFPAVLAGNWLGNKAFGKVSDAAWRTFVGLVLGLSALAALWRLVQA
ncbi:sulfite exporter TauE/SafE family protein [Novosphingobium sp.]|uniref:sulfite exporter TauE/SafE family protein n=1 Tax=Novosphingobium sp. TaxID=1874826 RepID=UPI0022C259C3|nr:sulfite exporter TauE/SafE family protein [Novosphingobium sp.]MCZ8019069.1 sulfite exporter TauE/SafE family protein [Novosphingobium sp.]MCZ8034877.1 sulfite exporter TauE/SafE family protein [Novosphingobium sp.]MCZ8052445.1 sulfite exporter TauE/SafE family protein [Novosphingobium sp.]MCZ8058544.1 sulfite exporter TauE/SafE family protein [Novosphingobium sp.]MCZ8232941.1 sulfite exporter TauE/SafE family protein [Novosphingobium sp.]